MMLRCTMILSLVTLLVAGVAVAGDKAWFDMENCAMCKNISSNPKMMENMTWEQHPITAGIVSVTMVKAAYIDAYRKAHDNMAKTGMRLQQGEMLEMCGSCTALGMCMMKGVDQEYVKTSNGDIWIVTSTDPKVVAELQSWAKRNKAEMAKMSTEG